MVDHGLDVLVVDLVEVLEFVIAHQFVKLSFVFGYVEILLRGNVVEWVFLSFVPITLPLFKCCF